MPLVHSQAILVSFQASKQLYTPPETNIAPENGWLKDDISFWDGLFSGAMLVSGRVFDSYF